MTNNFLLLNSDNTEILLIGPKNSTQNLLEHNLQLDGCTVTSSTVKNLAVTLDSNLSFENHIFNMKHGVSFHCYADDIQLFISSRPGETHQIEKLMECIVNKKNWMTNFLLLNSEKTEGLIIGPKNHTSNNLEHCLTLDGCSLDSSSSVRNLGVLFDTNLSFDSHVSSICKTAFFHLKNISKLRPMLSMSNAEMLIHAFMTSRLDYCNALLGGCSTRLINKLQMVQNAAANVLTRTRKYDHIGPVMLTLHWLPIKHRIDFKILLITYKALNGLAPQYLHKLLSHYSPPCPLRSQNSGLEYQNQLPAAEKFSI